MAARRQKSKRRSATTSPPDEKLVFFVDRSLGKGVRDALRAAGADVVYLEDEHQHDTSDERWLTTAGKHGYVVITKDKRIRLRLDERSALIAAGVRAFFLSSGNLSGAEMAALVTKHLDAMSRMVRETPPPFIAIVGRDEVTLLRQAE